MVATVTSAIDARPALAQGHSLESSTRVAVVVGGGFGGDSSLNTTIDTPLGTGELNASSSLDTSGVFGLRFTSPLATFLTLAGEIRFTRWSSDVSDDRNTLFDFSVMPAGRYVFKLNHVELEPYVGVPLGLTVNLLETDPPGSLGRGSTGFHVGVVGGLTLQFPVGIGVFVEGGWMHHEAFAKDDGNTHYRLILNQAVLNVGVSYAF